MADYTASYELLQSVHELGIHLQEALDQRDLDMLDALLAQRDQLLTCLQGMPKPLTVAPEWERMSHSITVQQQRLLHQLRALEGNLSETLGSITRFNKARQQYDTNGPQEPGILHRHVHG